MKTFKNFALLVSALIITTAFISCSDGSSENNNERTTNDSKVCTWISVSDESMFFNFYADKTAEFYDKDGLKFDRKDISYTGNPTVTGTVTIKGELKYTFTVTKNSSGVTATETTLGAVYIMEGSTGSSGDNDKDDSTGGTDNPGENDGTDDPVTPGGNDGTDDPVTPGDNDGTDTEGSSITPENPSTDTDESPLMFMGYENVVTIKNGTDTTEITSVIYSLTSDTTLKFKGGINAITLETVAIAISRNDTVKIALDLSEATGITEWTNKLAGQKTLYAISLPGTVTSIDNDAFTGCPKLKAITVQKSIPEYPEVDSAIIVNFAMTLSDWLNCTLLLPEGRSLYLDGKMLSGTLTIPDNVTSIRNSAFKNCQDITKVIITDSVTRIGDYAFHNCSGLTDVTLGNNIAYIGEYAFSSYPGNDNDGSNNSVVIPDSVSFIGKNAFQIPSQGSLCISFGENTAERGEGWCAFTGNIHISGSSIPSNAFLNCSEITQIEIDESVTAIGSRAFYGCTNLTALEIPNSVKTIGSSAFYGCTGLTGVTISKGVNKIEENAFGGCTGLTEITLPDSITDFIDGFTGCTNLADIYYDGTLGSWLNNGTIDFRHSDSVNFYIDGTNVKQLTDIEIPDSVEVIPEGAFSGWTNLTSVKISGAVKTIGSKAFYGCTGLTGVTISKGVNIIENNAFYGCSGLTSITLPDSITYCAYAFGFPSNLTSIYYDGTLETWLSKGGIGVQHNHSVDFYINKKNVTEITEIEIPDSIEVINDWAFAYWTSLTSVTIPDTVTQIGLFAFINCTVLTNIKLPAHITMINGSSFSSTGLTSLTIPDGVTSIGHEAFSNCSSLTCITLPDSLTNINSWAFGWCDNLTTINFRGTEEQWTNINKAEQWLISESQYPIEPAIVYNYTGD